MIKNFIFDVDRTLINSYEPELISLKSALKDVTGKNYSKVIMERLTTLTTEGFFKELGIEKESQIMKDINKYWGKYLSEMKINLFDGIEKQLQLLKERNCFLAIATSRTEEELNEVEELIKILNLFDIVITSDKVNYPKPNPESINMIINKFNLNKDETIYIGDSISDGIAAKKAQIKFGYANWDNKNQAKDYDYLLDSPIDITNKLL